MKMSLRERERGAREVEGDSGGESMLGEDGGVEMSNDRKRGSNAQGLLPSPERERERDFRSSVYLSLPLFALIFLEPSCLLQTSFRWLKMLQLLFKDV